VTPLKKLEKPAKNRTFGLIRPNRKDEQVLSFIRSYELQTGEAPTRQEIAEGVGLPNKMAAQRIVEKLRRHGMLNYESQAKRSLEIISVSSEEVGIAELSVLGLVAAGRPIEAIQRNDVSLKVPASMIRSGYPHFALKVSGNSMIEDSICDGDYVVVRQQAAAENGETVVALLDGEATLKRYYRKGNQVELRPANSSMVPIIVESHQHLRILGVYVGLIRMDT
jgi:repressor LexA